MELLRVWRSSVMRQRERALNWAWLAAGCVVGALVAAAIVVHPSEWMLYPALAFITAEACSDALALWKGGDHG